MSSKCQKAPEIQFFRKTNKWVMIKGKSVGSIVISYSKWTEETWPLPPEKTDKGKGKFHCLNSYTGIQNAHYLHPESLGSWSSWKAWDQYRLHCTEFTNDFCLIYQNSETTKHLLWECKGPESSGNGYLWTIKFYFLCPFIRNRWMIR